MSSKAFWAKHSIKSGRNQPGNPTEQGERVPPPHPGPRPPDKPEKIPQIKSTVEKKQYKEFQRLPELPSETERFPLKQGVTPEIREAAEKIKRGKK